MPLGRPLYERTPETKLAGLRRDVNSLKNREGPLAASLTPNLWSRSAVPLISPTATWEQNAVFEPDVHYESGTYKMWFSGGWSNPAMGYATCTSDPTDPANWTKHVGNPVLGQGGSSITGPACRVHVRKVAGVYHCFYSNNVAGLGHLKRSTSTDGISWTPPTTAIVNTAGTGGYGWANSETWFDGTYWWLFVEGSANAAGGSPWHCWLFRNTSIANDGGWVVQNGGNPLSSLSFAGTGYTNGYGQGPSIAEIDGTGTFQIGTPNVLWYHVQTALGTSDITHAFNTSSDLSDWTQPGVLDLAHSGGVYEKDQVADPCVLQVDGTSYFFYDGDDNATPFACINLATFAGTLEQLLNGSGGGGTTTGVISSDGSLTATNPSGPTVDLVITKVDGGSA